MSYRILLIKDARPGHFRKSEGVAKAIGRRLETEIDELPVASPTLAPPRVQRFLARHGPSPQLLLRRLWGIDHATLRTPDLIVSAGADTLVPNALLATLFGCRNVFIGSLRGLRPERFSAILHVRPELSHAPHHIVLLSPSAVDPDTLGELRPIGSLAELGGRTVTFLVGGPAPGFRFEKADWDGITSLVRATAERGLAWEIASSPRTPDAVVDLLARLARGLPRAVRFHDYRKEKSGSIEPLFAADAILVTEDSNTMISEAVASRRPVVVLRPRFAREEDVSLRALLDQAHAALAIMRDITPDTLLREINSTRPFEENPLDVLYERLAAAGIVPEQATGTSRRRPAR